jgi:type VI secretion system protein ImpH
MATARGREGPGLSDQLFREPFNFDFFQAIRLLERLASEDARFRNFLVGQDHPEQEAVRFRSQPSLSFPPSSIIQIRPLTPDASSPSKPTPLAEMVVSFMGVVGPTGVLPYHYTALLLRRIRDKDFSLRDFLDLFHHRAISLFYRAGVKYRLPCVYERSKLESGPAEDAEDRITGAFYCLTGMGTRGLRGRMDVADQALLFYGGHFAHFPRSASVLENMLADYFGLPVRVLQLQGQWLQLDPSEQAIMPSQANRLGQNNQLGVSMVVGDRVWDIQSKFRLQVGPLTYAQFQRFLPNGDALRPLCQLAHAYVGLEFDFDVQLLLRPDEVPASRAGGGRSRLGWNTWSRTGDFRSAVDDAVFSLSDI